MKLQTQFILLISCLSLVGCGGDANDDVSPTAPATTTTVSAPVVAVEAPVTTPPVAAPPAASSPAAMEPAAPDLLASYKVSADGSPNKSDLEALQAVVDGYAFGPDGLGAPPLNNLEELITKGYLKRLPTPPKGMKWAYDSPKWKVSLVPQ